MWPSAETGPGRTEATRASPASTRSTRASESRNAGADAVADAEWTTTVSAELERPSKPRSICARACTDSEPSACQPAPESAVSTFGAKAARTRAAIAQAMAIARA